jgi:hypothetical protein
LVSAQPKIGIDVTQLMCHAALKHVRRRRPQALVDLDQVLSVLNRVQQQFIVKAPRNAQLDTTQPRK